LEHLRRREHLEKSPLFRLEELCFLAAKLHHAPEQLGGFGLVRAPFEYERLDAASRRQLGAPKLPPLLFEASYDVAQLDRFLLGELQALPGDPLHLRADPLFHLGSILRSPP
jgi:hypothetical protein